MEKVRIFIDFWNLQLQWNESTGRFRLDWQALPHVLVQESMKLAGIQYYQDNGTKVYASVNMTSGDDRNLKRWLETFLKRQPR